MTPRGRRGARFALLVTVVASFLLPAPAATADEGSPRTYEDAAYSGMVRESPTQSESQSKLWFHDGAWWALMSEPTGPSVRVNELMPDHTWRPTSAVVNTAARQVGDALLEDDVVNVVTRSDNGDLEYARLAYDADARDYTVVVKEVVTIAGGNASPTIARDGAGDLWVGYANGRGAVVIRSGNGGLTWGEPRRFSMPGEGGAIEVGALMPYDDRMGFMWSSQRSNSFQFASHRNGTDPTSWSVEPALSGAGQADNHISLVRVPGQDGDTLLAAVKTSVNDQDVAATEFLVKLLVRRPNGTWTSVPAATIADELSDPLLQVDLETRTLYLFAAANSGDIVVKTTSLDDLQFDSGLGQLFMLSGEGRLVNPTGSREPLTAESGLVLLADDATNRMYRHAEMPLGATTSPAPDDEGAPPGPPTDVHGGAVSSDTVVLSWSPGVDRSQWSPAGEAPAAREFVVSRDGERIATLSDTSLRDTPRTGLAADELSVVYQVRTIDEAGNRSRPVEVTVTLPAAPSRLPFYLGAGAVLLAALGALYRVYRRARLDHRTTDGPTVETVERELSPAGERAGKG